MSIDELSQEWLDALQRSIDESNEEIKKQEELEKLDPPGREREEYEGIRWYPNVREVWVKGEKEPFAEISYGVKGSCMYGSMLFPYCYLNDLIENLKKIKPD